MANLLEMKNHQKSRSHFHLTSLELYSFSIKTTAIATEQALCFVFKYLINVKLKNSNSKHLINYDAFLHTKEIQFQILLYFCLGKVYLFVSIIAIKRKLFFHLKASRRKYFYGCP